MEIADVLRPVVAALDDVGIDHAVVGSVASMNYGEPRFTLDVDILIDPTSAQLHRLCRAFPESDWYVSEPAAQNALQHRRQFNVIHPKSGMKIDFMIVRDAAWNRQQLARRIRRPVEAGFDAWMAHPEDVILGKLLYYREGGSDKHVRDIASMLKLSDEPIDRSRVAEWADRLGVRAEWEHIVAKVDDGNP
jgi:hypothetical protein